MSNGATIDRTAGAAAESTVKVWDPIVRVFHWSLVTSFFVAWLTAEEWDTVHEWAGYIAGGLVVFRILWGLVGTRYARFTQFVRAPRAVSGFLLDMLRGREKRYIGHNPAGGAMIVALIVMVAATALTGWMLTLDAYRHVRWVHGIHESFANLMLVMVGIHIAGVLFASLRHRENLVRAMIHGRKRAPEPTDIA